MMSGYYTLGLQYMENIHRKYTIVKAHLIIMLQPNFFSRIISL
jgi:hypothetical protein